MTKKEFIKSMLMDMKINPLWRGFEYTIDCVVFLDARKTLFKSIQTSLYTIVARKHKTTALSVQKAIQYAVKHSVMKSYSNKKLLYEMVEGVKKWEEKNGFK